MKKDMKLGDLVIEGKTKKVYKIEDEPGHVLLISKDRITAGDGAKAHDLEGKAVISTQTTCRIFEYLSAAGINTHYVRQHDDKSFVARHCEMIPIEWVTRRIATGSFLRRNPGVEEGYRFCPPKLETFFKDDANHDPQWSYEQIVSAKFQYGSVTIRKTEVDIMLRMTQTIFEVLEKAWASLNCSLIDMKVEYGVVPETGELVLADVIDSDSWRLWPSGDKRLMVDKQVYRNAVEVTSEKLDEVRRNFAWVAEQIKKFAPKPTSQVVILMGSSSDLAHCQKITAALDKYGIPHEMRVTSAHKGPEDTLKILAQYEGEGIPTVFITVAGRSNGLGPVAGGNTTFPVITCPPVTPETMALDVWSSVRLPSSIGCSLVLDPGNAALCAAQILALRDHVIWARLRGKQLNTYISLKKDDAKLTSKD